MIKTLVKRIGYKDSIFLMGLTKELVGCPGVRQAVVVMGTAMNKTVVAEFGGLTPEAAAAHPDELLVSLEVEDEAAVGSAMARLTQLMETGAPGPAGAAGLPHASLSQAAAAVPDAELVFLSVPGEYAAREMRTALDSGRSVFVFSDNVPLEEEAALKRHAAEKDLWLMGPGCGSAVLDGISYGLMSRVARGRIGIVGASGSGIHEIAALVTRGGQGISQAIGTGGRDLCREVGGVTMLRGIDFLDQDPGTAVLVLVSKPPHPAVERRILERVQACGKPVVIFFLGGDAEAVRRAGAYAAASLEDAAALALALADGGEPPRRDYVADCTAALAPVAAEERAGLRPRQRYLRGVYCGGTHNEEAILLLKDRLPGLRANVAFGGCQLLEDPRRSVGHSLVDVGDEVFTRGKPHPVMDPSILCDRLWAEGTDPEVAVLLFDLLLGYGAHPDPVGTIEDTLHRLRQHLRRENRHLCLVASVTGSPLDPQGLEDQVRRLSACGVRVLESNARAAILSGLIIEGHPPGGKE